jgi:hypothetical protein
MSTPHTPHTPHKRRVAQAHPVNPDSELAAIIERNRNLYVDLTMCVGVLVTVVCLVVATHVLADWLQLAI